MIDEPVYTLEDAVQVCLEDAWAMYLYMECPGRTRSWARQNTVRRVTVELRIESMGGSCIHITFRGYHQRDVYADWWPLEHVGPAAVKIRQI